MWREEKSRGRKAPDPAPLVPTYVPTEEGILLSGLLGNTVWNLTRMFTGRRELTKDEIRSFGAALDPVLMKYAPMLENWKAEAALVSTLFILWQSTAPPAEGTTDGDAGPAGDGSGAGTGAAHAVPHGLGIANAS